MDQPAHELPMPSDVRRAAARAAELAQPPGKLALRLFLLPLVIAGGVLAIMVPIGWLAGGSSDPDRLIADLRASAGGGARTGPWLVGPAAKQRYIDAKSLVDLMKQGMSEQRRVKLTDQLIDLLEHGTSPDEGQVQQFMLLAVGRVWQVDPQQERKDGPLNGPEAVAARQRAVAELLKFARLPNAATVVRTTPALKPYEGQSPQQLEQNAPIMQRVAELRRAQLPSRKAAILALMWWGGRAEARAAIPMLVEKLRSDDDLDVRIAAASALGPLASPDDAAAVEALTEQARNSTGDEIELAWASAGSLAQLNRPEARDWLLRLLDRAQLAALEYTDRETDPQRPQRRKLSDREQDRILVNTLLAVERYDDAQVRQRIEQLAASDPSERVRQQAIEIVARRRSAELR